MQNALTTANQNGIAPPSGGGMSGGGSGGGGSVSNVIVGNDKDAVISSPAVSSGEYRNVFSYVVAKNDVIAWTVAYVTPTFYFYPLKGAN